MSGITVATFGKRRLLVCFSLFHFVSTIRHALLTIQLYSVTFNLLFCFVLPKKPKFQNITCFCIFSDVDECNTTLPCQNNGICTNNAGSYNCDCIGTGYDGTDCTIGMI